MNGKSEWMKSRINKDKRKFCYCGTKVSKYIQITCLVKQVKIWKGG